MERVTKEGTVATAATYAHMFSSLPSCGRPTRLMVYDLHTLQNRFYLVRYVCVVVVAVIVVGCLVEFSISAEGALLCLAFMLVLCFQRVVDCGVDKCHDMILQYLSTLDARRLLPYVPQKE